MLNVPLMNLEIAISTNNKYNTKISKTYFYTDQRNKMLYDYRKYINFFAKDYLAESKRSRLS